jgi:hypothetical protein
MRGLFAFISQRHRATLRPAQDRRAGSVRWRSIQILHGPLRTAVITSEQTDRREQPRARACSAHHPDPAVRCHCRRVVRARTPQRWAIRPSVRRRVVDLHDVERRRPVASRPTDQVDQPVLPRGRRENLPRRRHWRARLPVVCCGIVDLGHRDARALLEEFEGCPLSAPLVSEADRHT